MILRAAFCLRDFVCFCIGVGVRGWGMWVYGGVRGGEGLLKDPV